MSQSLQYHRVSGVPSCTCSSNGNDVVLDLLWGSVPDRTVFWLVGSNELFCQLNSKVFDIGVLEVSVLFAEYVAVSNSYIKQKPHDVLVIFPAALGGHGSTP